MFVFFWVFMPQHSFNQKTIVFNIIHFSFLHPYPYFSMFRRFCLCYLVSNKPHKCKTRHGWHVYLKRLCQTKNKLLKLCDLISQQTSNKNTNAPKSIDTNSVDTKQEEEKTRTRRTRNWHKTRRRRKEEEEQQNVLLSHIAGEKRSTFKDMGCSAYAYGWKAKENSISFNWYSINSW